MDIAKCEQVKVEELFPLDHQKGMPASKVLITGAAGSGKSMLSLHLLHLWLEGRLPATENVF